MLYFSWFYTSIQLNFHVANFLFTKSHVVYTDRELYIYMVTNFPFSLKVFSKIVVVCLTKILNFNFDMGPLIIPKTFTYWNITYMHGYVYRRCIHVKSIVAGVAMRRCEKRHVCTSTYLWEKPQLSLRKRIKIIDQWDFVKATIPLVLFPLMH